jgi:RND family efflux transporter MFP subunit
MTPALTSVRLVLLTMAGTVALCGGALYVQHARNGWPFDRPGATAPAVRGTAGLAAPDTPDRVAVDVSPEAMRQLGIRIEPVREDAISQTVRAVATVVPDESRLAHVHTRVAGWVEQLHVNTTGEFVRAGQPLARIFSQELLSSQTEYLAARRMAASGLSSVVVGSGRARLRVLGMTEEEIAAIEATGEPMRLVTVVAPASGVVANRGVTVGTSVDPSTELLTIADLSRVWVLAEVPEADIPAVRSGIPAQLDFPASGLAPFAARAEFVYPMLTEQTRTLRVRLSAPNPRGALKPGLYGAAVFEAQGRTALTVPRDAVVDTGLQQHVFVPVAPPAGAGEPRHDTAAGFEPRVVRIGARFADRVEIVAGLEPGEHIVTTGVFLLDSESRLRATGGSGGHVHGATPPERQPDAADPNAAIAPAADPHAGH